MSKSSFQDGLLSGLTLTASACLSAASMIFAVLPIDVVVAQGFFDRAPNGWNFYLEEPPPPEVEAEPPQPPQPAEVAPPAPLPEQAVAPPVRPTEAALAGPEPFSAEWTRETLPKLRDKAWTSLKQEDVAAYFYLQRYAMDQSQEFAERAQRVVLADALLDQNARGPIASFASQAAGSASREATLDTATAIAQNAGIFYFYRSDCPYCKQQDPILERLQRRLGLIILPIALDGLPMEGSSLSGFVPDNGLAQELNVTVTPTLFMVRPPNTYVPLGSGVLSDDQIIRRMVDGAYEANWITDEAYQRTKVVAPPLLAEAPGSLPVGNVDPLEDPEAFIAAIRSRLKSGRAENPLGPLADMVSPGVSGSVNQIQPGKASPGLGTGAADALQQLLQQR